MIPARHSVWIGHGVGAALFLATILNGLGSFAKRVGLIERESYEQYWAYRCGEQGTKPVLWRLGRQCVASKAEPTEWRARRGSHSSYVVVVRESERPLKLAKDVVFVGMCLLGGSLWLRRRIVPPRAAWPLWGLLGLVLALSVAALARGEGTLALAGLRSFGFLPVALLWTSATSAACLAPVVSWCLALSLVECALIPWEVLGGVSLMTTSWLPIRFAGTLVHPNTMGMFAVVYLGFALCFVKSRWTVVLLWTVSIILVLCSGSGLGWVALVVLAVMGLATRLQLSPVIMASASIAFAIFCLSALSLLTGRPEVLVSAAEGRMTTLQRTINRDIMANALGEGLGVGTNSAVTGLKSRDLPSDSTVTTLLRQTGLAGLCLFYLGIALACLRNRQARPFFLVLFLSSLALNVTEAFPVNALLGLALAHSFGRQG